MKATADLLLGLRDFATTTIPLGQADEVVAMFRYSLHDLHGSVGIAATTAMSRAPVREQLLFRVIGSDDEMAKRTIHSHIDPPEQFLFFRDTLVDNRG